MIQCASIEEFGQQVPPAPWEISSAEFAHYIRGHLAVDCLLVAAFDLKNPQADEVMALAGEVIPERVPSMLQQLPISDHAFQIAVANGVAQTEADHSACQAFLPSADPAGSVLYVVLPHGFGSDCSWFLAVCRQRGPFNNPEVHALRRLLNQWAARFDTPNEPNMLRLLVGHDNRTILIDPAGEQRLIDEGIDRKSLVQHIHTIEKQRWDEAANDETHDLTLSINNAPWWVRLHHHNTLGTLTGDQSYLELRQLTAGEMTAVAEIKDARVAHALALIHDRYCQSLTLEELSSAVGISLFHFHRLFSQHVGMTPKQYILQKQIQVARWMLRTRRTPVSQIAELTGFASHGHFTSTFSRIVGMNPSTYRERAQRVPSGSPQ